MAYILVRHRENNAAGDHPVCGSAVRARCGGRRVQELDQAARGARGSE